MAPRDLVRLLTVATVAACGQSTAIPIANDDFPTSTPPATDGGARSGSTAHDAAHPLDAFYVGAPTVVSDGGVTCTDGGFPAAYVLDSMGAFYTFDADSLTTTLIGTPACNDDSSTWDFSVSAEGAAYVIYADWRLFKVDLHTLACTPSPFADPRLTLFTSAVLPTAHGEEMLFYGYEPDKAGSGAVLAGSDLTSFSVTQIGQVPKGVLPSDVKADAFGNLFGLASNGVYIQLDPASGAIIEAGQTAFSAGSWALLLLGRDVYFFGDSTVYRYAPNTHALTVVGTVAPTVVGASAVPCLQAP